MRLFYIEVQTLINEAVQVVIILKKASMEAKYTKIIFYSSLKKRKRIIIIVALPL